MVEAGNAYPCHVERSETSQILVSRVWENSEILRFAQNDNSLKVSTLQRDFNFRPARAQCHV
jgi:hypothetical protein